MGVHRFTPILAITCDMDSITSVHRRRVNMLRVWNHIVNMNSTSLINMCLCMIKVKRVKPGGQISKLLEQVNIISSFPNKSSVDLKTVEERPLNLHKINWSNKMQTVSKLRAYKQFMSSFGTEKYLFSKLSKIEKIKFSAV